MDPLSVIASVVGIAGAIAKSLDGLQKIPGAPAELHALINETSDIQVILETVQTAVRDSEGQDDSHGVSAILNRVKDQLLELEKLINYRLIRPGNHDKNG